MERFTNHSKPSGQQITEVFQALFDGKIDISNKEDRFDGVGRSIFDETANESLLNSCIFSLVSKGYSEETYIILFGYFSKFIELNADSRALKLSPTYRLQLIDFRRRMISERLQMAKRLVKLCESNSQKSAGSNSQRKASVVSVNAPNPIPGKMEPGLI